MRPDERFLRLPRSFWAHVRLISQEIGYTIPRGRPGAGRIRIPSPAEVASVLRALGIDAEHLRKPVRDVPLGDLLYAYFESRSIRLSDDVAPLLMDALEARQRFESLRDRLQPRCPLPMNKQKGEKAGHAYLTGMVNMLIEAGIGDGACDYDPRTLTTFTRKGVPLRTLARRVDGAFPAPLNPVALWEIKEYYYTTTFGSRVADGVYESLLDGMELEELAANEKVRCLHYLIVDSRYTWWACGRSRLCRIWDLMHMGYVDEALFGREIVERIPAIVPDWIKMLSQRHE